MESQPTPPSDRQTLRTMVRGAYDLQKLRIAVGNRIVGNFRAKLGQEPGKRAVDTLDKEAQALLADLKRHYRRIADGLMERKVRPEEDFPGDELISTYTEFALVSQYLDLDTAEVEHFKRLETVLKSIPIYTEFLEKVRGIGPALAGVIASEIDIHKARYPSSLWAYAGLDVASDGLGRSKRKEHLVRRPYINRSGAPCERDSITYNPFLKTKLIGVLATSLLRCKSEYRVYYDQYRHRIETDPARVITDKPGRHTDNTWTKMRRHDAAKRYMVKMFLCDLYNRWRVLEGLPVAPTYHEAKQGHVHRERAA